VLRTLRLLLGTTAVIAGIILLGLALPARHAAAGIEPPPCDATPNVPLISSAAPLAEADFAVPTCTPVRKIKTATPTFTATVPATDTPEPTVAPTDTPVPPTETATSPSGGAGGASIEPPNTGDGASGSSGLDATLLGAGALLLVAGAGSLALAARRR
jgi:hypothetical protein